MKWPLAAECRAPCRSGGDTVQKQDRVLYVKRATDLAVSKRL
jgi:hypothetical protein